MTFPSHKTNLAHYGNWIFISIIYNIAAPGGLASALVVKAEYGMNYLNFQSYGPM